MSRHHIWWRNKNWSNCPQKMGFGICGLLGNAQHNVTWRNPQYPFLWSLGFLQMCELGLLGNAHHKFTRSLQKFSTIEGLCSKGLSPTWVNLLYSYLFLSSLLVIFSFNYVWFGRRLSFYGFVLLSMPHLQCYDLSINIEIGHCVLASIYPCKWKAALFFQNTKSIYDTAFVSMEPDGVLCTPIPAELILFS